MPDHLPTRFEIDGDPLIPSPVAARMCGQSPATWRYKRCRGTSLPYVRIGQRAFYRKSVIDAFLKANTFNNTSEEAAAKAAES